jgi:hypothetical protein
MRGGFNMCLSYRGGGFNRCVSSSLAGSVYNRLVIDIHIYIHIHIHTHIHLNTYQVGSRLLPSSSRW